MAEAHPQRKKIKLAREATEVLDPSKCHVSGEGLQEAVVEETSSVILESVVFFSMTVCMRCTTTYRTNNSSRANLVYALTNYSRDK